MSIDDFNDMMPHTVTVTPSAGTFDEFGAPVLGTPVQYTARVKYQPTRVVGPSGVTITAAGVAWLSTTVEVTLNDRFEYEYDTTVSPSVFRELDAVAVDFIPDEDGDHHVKVYFK